MIQIWYGRTVLASRAFAFEERRSRDQYQIIFRNVVFSETFIDLLIKFHTRVWFQNVIHVMDLYSSGDNAVFPFNFYLFFFFQVNGVRKVSSAKAIYFPIINGSI